MQENTFLSTAAKRSLYVLNLLEKYCDSFLRFATYGKIFLIPTAALLLVLLIQQTPFDRVLIKDALYYVQKGMEIKASSFTHISLNKPQAIGWPLFLSLCFSLFRVENLFQAMFVARWVTIIVTCCIAIPLYILGNSIYAHGMSRKGNLLAFVLLASVPLVQFTGKEAMTEPLFCFLTLWTFVFLVNDELKLINIIYASACASLSYWVRPNGIFQLAVILITVCIIHKDSFSKIIRYCSVALLIFISISAPHLLMRYHEFGSAFDYGHNSKYFIDTSTQLWADNIPVPTLSEYLRTHSWRDYIAKFFHRGFWAVIYTFYTLLLPIFWPVLSTVGQIHFLLKRRRKLYCIAIFFVINIAGLSIIFDIFGSIRHLMFFVPFIILIDVDFLTRIFQSKVPLGNCAILITLFYLLTAATQTISLDTSHIKQPKLNDLWALWAVQNLEGNVLIAEGGSLLRIGQHYSYPQLKRKPIPFKDVKEYLHPILPNTYSTLAEALPWLREKNIQYIVTDPIGLGRHRYLKELSQERWKNTFEKINYFANGKPGSYLLRITIYKVHLD